MYIHYARRRNYERQDFLTLKYQEFVAIKKRKHQSIPKKQWVIVVSKNQKAIKRLKVIKVRNLYMFHNATRNTKHGTCNLIIYLTVQ